MHPAIAMVKSSDGNLIDSSQQIGSALGLVTHTQSRPPGWLLELLNEEAAVAIFDWDREDPDNLVWIQLVRQLRPKVPLIVLHEGCIDHATGAKFCEQKVFYFCQRPIAPQVLHEVLQAALQAGA